MANSSLIKAKKQKNDEFYTRIEDIEREVMQYQQYFKDKVVYCNCDDPEESNFWKFFELNFEYFGLKKLISTHFDQDKQTYKLELCRDINNDGKINNLDIVKTLLSGNGDFRSPESIELLKESDIVVTNPPFSCYSSDTEVLTSNGWKLFKDVDIKTDLIYSLNPETNQIEIVKAIDFIKSPINGKLYNFKNRFMDLAITGNHKMFSYLGNKYIGLIDASKIKKSYAIPIKGFLYENHNDEKFILPSTIQKEQYSKKDIVIPQKEIDINDWLEFFGFWLADGCTRQGLNSNGNQRYEICIKQLLTNKDYVIGLFERIGFNCKVSVSEGNKGNFTIYNKQLWEYLNQFGKSEQKYIPRHFLNLGKTNLFHLYKGYINGDSHKGNNGIILSSKSKQLMSDFQEIILKLFGQIVTVRTVNAEHNNKPYKYYMISFANTYHHNFSKYGIPKMIDYNDYVYCLTLEKNHIMLVKRNGKISWCGNCFREYIAQLIEYNKQFLVIGNKNAVTYKEVFPLIRDNKIWLGLTCPKDFLSPENEIKKLGLCNWFTNLPNKKRNEEIILFKEFNENDFPKYDNYIAWNVDKTKDIPVDKEIIVQLSNDDYEKAIKIYNDDCQLLDIDKKTGICKVLIKRPIWGVPISFLDKYNPNQFEIYQAKECITDTVGGAIEERIGEYSSGLVWNALIKLKDAIRLGKKIYKSQVKGEKYSLYHRILLRIKS